MKRLTEFWQARDPTWCGKACWPLSTWDDLRRDSHSDQASQVTQQAKAICLQCESHREWGFSPCVGKIPWRRDWQPTPVFLPGESHGQRSLVGYSPWGHKASDRTEVMEQTGTQSLGPTGGSWDRCEPGPVLRVERWLWRQPEGQTHSSAPWHPGRRQVPEFPGGLCFFICETAPTGSPQSAIESSKILPITLSFFSWVVLFWC